MKKKKKMKCFSRFSNPPNVLRMRYIYRGGLGLKFAKNPSPNCQNTPQKLVIYETLIFVGDKLSKSIPKVVYLPYGEWDPQKAS